MKLELTNSQVEFLEFYGKCINKTYYFFPKVYKKLDNNEFEELSLDQIPAGIKKYIENHE